MELKKVPQDIPIEVNLGDLLRGRKEIIDQFQQPVPTQEKVKVFISGNQIKSKTPSPQALPQNIPIEVNLGDLLRGRKDIIDKFQQPVPPQEDVKVFIHGNPTRHVAHVQFT